MTSSDTTNRPAKKRSLIRDVERQLYILAQHIEHSDLLDPIRQATMVLADMEHEGAAEEPEYNELLEAIAFFERALDRIHVATHNAHDATWDLRPREEWENESNR